MLGSILLQHDVEPERIAAPMLTREEPDDRLAAGSPAGIMAMGLTWPPSWADVFARGNAR